MTSLRLSLARALLRSTGVRAAVRRAESHPRIGRLLTAAADRLLGDVGNYRAALASDTRAPDPALLAAIVASAAPPWTAATGPVVLAIDNLEAGGAQRQLVLTARGLLAAGVSDVRVACRSSRIEEPGGAGFFRAELEPAGVTVEALGPDTGACRDLRLADALGMALAADVEGFLALFLRWRPAVVHAWLDWPNVAAGLAAHLAGVPRIVLGARNVGPAHLGLQHGAFEPLYRALLGTGRAVLLANSQAGVDDYARWLAVPGDTIVLLRNGFESSGRAAPQPDRDSCRARLGLPAGTPLIGAIARHAPEKDPELWLATAAAIHARRPDVRFAMWGDGPSAAAVRRRVRTLGLERVVTLHPPHRPVEDVLGALDVLLATSRAEGTPNVLIEAAWQGVPVVATASGGTAETMLDGVTGRLLEVRDPGALADAVLDVLSWPPSDPDRLRSGRAMIESRFSQATMISATLAVYRMETPRAQPSLSGDPPC